MKSGNQYKISDDIHHTGDCDSDERCSGITDAPEDTADQIIGDDDQRAASADPEVCRRRVKSFRRCLHDGGNLSCKQDHNQHHGESHRAEQIDAGTDSPPSFFLLSSADLLPQQNCRSHGKSGDDIGDGHHHL